jgi:nucleolar protein 9
VLNLVKHRFASHCCETLFLSAAPVMSKEMDVDYVPDKEEEGDDAEIPTMEILFLDMLNDIRPELRMLVTDTFGSHVVRTLLLILSGRPVSEAATVVQSRKKESVVAGMGAASEETRVVPRSFYEEVRKVLKAISEGFTKDELRRLAVHPIGSPTLQVVLQIDLGRSKKERRNAEGSVVEKLAGINDKGKHDSENSKSDKTPEAETDSDERQFFRNLLYDPVGSHLAEHLVKVAPKKEFNILYKKFFKSRLGSLARNETAAFVVQRILEKLVAKELEEAVTEILPQVPSLMGKFILFFVFCRRGL